MVEPLNNSSFLFSPLGNEQPYASSGSESDVEDVSELPDAISSVNVIQVDDDVLSEHITMLKLDEDNLATKNTSSDSVQAQADGPVVASTRIYDLPFTWRSALSKVYVWYACFGSNMWKPRFLCYIEGGKVKLKTHCLLYLARNIRFLYWSFVACCCIHHIVDFSGRFHLVHAFRKIVCGTQITYRGYFCISPKIGKTYFSTAYISLLRVDVSIQLEKLLPRTMAAHACSATIEQTFYTPWLFIPSSLLLLVGLV